VTALTPNRICFDIPFPYYLKEPGVSKSALDWFAKSPEHYRDYTTGAIEKADTGPMTFGRMAHAACLEGLRDYVVKPTTNDEGDTWHGNKRWCKEWLADNEDATILSSEEHSQIIAAEALVRSHPLAAPLLAQGRPEVSIFAKHERTGLQLKGRVDWLGPDYAVDLKFVQCAATDAFSRQLFTYRWHVQAGLYSHILNANGYDMKAFYFIAIERANPVRLNVRRLKLEAIDLGWWTADRDLTELAECIEDDYWPGYCDPSGEIQEINLPKYAFSMDDMPLIGAIETKETE
jgi:hypothetical protein